MRDSSGWAAPCCARNAAAPFLIVGDDQSQLSLGFVQSGVVAEAGPDGASVFRSTDVSEISRTYRLDGATLLSDRWQAGVSVLLRQNQLVEPNFKDSHLGLGDVRLSLGFEANPIWSYSSWEPQVFLFSGVTLPTGKSIYDSGDLSGFSNASVTGDTGTYTVTVGSLFLKKWQLWDAFLIPEAHYFFSRKTRSGDTELLVNPSFGGSVSLGVGFSPGGGSFRFGMRLRPLWEEGRTVSGMGAVSNRQVPLVSSTDFGLDSSYLLNQTDTLILSYTDQTLLGPASNNYLSRSILLSYQHRWPR